MAKQDRLPFGTLIRDDLDFLKTKKKLLKIQSYPLRMSNVWFRLGLVWVRIFPSMLIVF